MTEHSKGLHVIHTQIVIQHKASESYNMIKAGPASRQGFIKFLPHVPRVKNNKKTGSLAKILTS